jgi:DNA-binding HxlR family transcriptional regulator
MGRGYGEYCPIAKASEVLAERWTPLIVRNLHLGCHSFSEIQQGLPRISSTLLADRLRSLERDGVVERVPSPTGRGSRYYLTDAGEELAGVVSHMGDWGARWLDLGPRDYDPYMVLWGWVRTLDLHRLPERRIVVRVDVTDRPREHFWMLIERPQPELCVKNPGLDEDLVLSSDCVTLADVHRGRLAFNDAVRDARLSLEGPRVLVKDFPSWGGLSPFARVRPAGASA